MNRIRTKLVRSRFVAAAATLTIAAGGLVAVPLATPAEAASLPKCPVNALKNATTPVEVTFWHGLNRANEETLQRLTDQFNTSQSEVKVNLVNQIGYRETLEKFTAGLTSGDLPDMLQLEDIATQQAIDTQAMLPVQSCIKADKYSTSDFVPRVLKRYTVEKVLWPMPFNVSNPVFLYDKNAFTDAGLDPEKPPTTLAGVKQAAKKIKATGEYEAGYGLKLDPWYLEQWSAKADELYVNNANGRKARATKVEFDDASGRGIFAWMNSMVKSGLAITNSAEGGSAYDNLLGIRSKKVGMSIDSSATLGTITQVLVRRRERRCRSRRGPDARTGRWRRRARRRGCALHGEAVVGREEGRGVEVPQVPREPPDPGRLRRRHRVRADPQVVGDAPRRDRPVGDHPGLQGRVRPAPHRRRRCRHPGSRDRRVLRRARRSARGRAGDVHPGQVAEGRDHDRRRQGEHRDAELQLQSRRLTDSMVESAPPARPLTD